VETDSVELPPAATEVGLKLAVAPVGNPVTPNPIVPLNPPDTDVLTEYDVPVPAVTVWLEGIAPTEKSPAELTTSVTVVECVNVPLVPVTVRG
jgi:hypothetical protein